MKIQLVPDAGRVLRHAHSVKLIGLASIFSGLEFVFNVLSDHPPIPRGIFAGLGFVVMAGAFAFRFIAQKEFGTDGDQG